MATLDDLIVVKSSTTYQTEMLADLANPAIVGGSGMPATSWQAGSVPRTLIAAQAEVSADLNTAQRAIADGGFLSSAAGDWLTLLADEQWDVQRDDAVATIGIATLTDGGGGPYTPAVGALIASDSSGNQFRNITTGTLALSGTLALRWKAVETGAGYNIGNGSLTTLVTALAGVTINNPATWLTLPGTAAAAAQGTIRITDGASTGPHVVGAGTVTVNDGAGHSYTNTNSFTITTAGGYADVLFTASAVGLASNVANNVITTVAITPVVGLTSNNPGTTWITTSGADEQSDSDLQEECRDKWATLGIGWTSDAIEYLAKQAATTTHVTRVRVTSNPGGVAGLVGVTIGSIAGVMNAADVAAVQAYFDDGRTTLTSSITVSSCTALTVNITGTIRVPAAYAALAQSNAERNLLALEQSVPIGGSDDALNTLPLEDIIAAIKNATYDSSGNQTNASSPIDIDLTAPTGDTALTSAQVPDLVYSALVWQAV